MANWKDTLLESVAPGVTASPVVALAVVAISELATISKTAR
jgi:hypothetical protein